MQVTQLCSEPLVPFRAHPQYLEGSTTKSATYVQACGHDSNARVGVSGGGLGYGEINEIIVEQEAALSASERLCRGGDEIRETHSSSSGIQFGDAGF